MHRGHRRVTAPGDRWSAALVGLLLVGLAGACGPEADQPLAAQGQSIATYTDPSVYRVAPEQLRRLVSELDPESPQRAILADGRVSRSELEDAWGDYEACIHRAGFVLTTSAWDPVTTTTRIFTYARGPAATVAETRPTGTSAARPTADALTDGENELLDDCEERYWFPVSAVYAADTPPHMEPRLAAAVEGCMVRRGYPVHGATDFGAMVGAVRGEAKGERVQAGRECLSHALSVLYPDLPYYPRP